MQRTPDIPFTYEYSQPEEYHFSLDSIEMPWQVAQYFKNKIAEEEINKKDLEQFKTLDLCAGCGVLGFELNFHIPELKQIDFLEVQSVYQEHFEHNKKLALANASKKPFRPRLVVVREEATPMITTAEPQLNFLNMNYDQLLGPEHQDKYDLILCNPPYFVQGQGKLSPSEFKNRCRFFIDSDFTNLVSVLCHTLKQNGQAFLLLRPLDDHGLDLFTELRRLIKGKLECESLGEVRGTFLLKLSR